MKKILFLLIATIAIGTSYAQPIVQSELFDNISLTVKGGVVSPLQDLDDVKGMVGLELRKQITPVTGLGLDGDAMFNTSKHVGQMYSYNVLDHTYVGTFMTTNWMNLVGGYKGAPRTFELETVVGFGWIHSYLPQVGDKNDMGFKTGVNANLNINDNFAVSLKPVVLWNAPKLNSNYAALQVCVGLTYKFKNHDGRKNFTLCNKVATQKEVDDLNRKINDLRRKYKKDMRDANQQIEELSNKNKYLQLQTDAFEQHECPTPPEPELPKIGFVINSSKIHESSYVTIDAIVKKILSDTSKYIVVGYASVDGDEKFNNELSLKRAESVMEALIEAGVPEDRISAIGMGETEGFSKDVLQLNRVVVVK